MAKYTFTPNQIQTALRQKKNATPFILINDELATEELFYKVRAAKEFLKHNPSFDDLEVSTKITISGFFTLPLKHPEAPEPVDLVCFTDIEIFLDYNAEDDSISPTLQHSDIRLSHIHIGDGGDEINEYVMNRYYKDYRNNLNFGSDKVSNYIEKHCPQFTFNLTDYIDTDFIFNMVDMASTALKITNSESKGIKKAPTLVQ